MGIRAEETLEGAQDAHGDMRPERGSHVVSVRLTNVSLDPQEAGGLSAKWQHPEKLFSKHKEKLRHSPIKKNWTNMLLIGKVIC